MARRATQRPRGARRRTPAPTAVQRTGSVTRWVNGVLLGSACLVVLATTAYAMQYLLALDVRRIAVSGTVEQLAAADIESLVAEEVGAGFLMIDLDGIRHRLEQMPWIYMAEVRRHWPDTIGIRVHAQQPVARWGDDGFLNHAGDYFPGDQAQFVGLPKLDGPRHRGPQLMSRYLELERALSPTGLQVAYLSEDAIRQLTVEFSNGTRLSLGDHAFAARVQRFIRLWGASLGEQSIARVDMRYEHGAAVLERASRFAARTSPPGGN